MIKFDKELDCTGLMCPMPIVKTKEELDKLSGGQVLLVLADDYGFQKDMSKWCQMTGNEFFALEKEGNIFKGYIKKKQSN